ncbi:PucR family transcriptional regulator [Nocardia jiangxiensis]|uniref:PucR family transcriptional regulator n=1 Tax=Nocardia jiangxiensis TaxID=282685 RepID=UPI000311969D|nr:helix-turn-helix domain-containing protein [Nocardia jiangxiensis]
MSAAILPATARMLAELLTRTAAATGFRAARILLATAATATDGCIARAGVVVVRRDDPLVRLAEAATGPVPFPVAQLSDTALAGIGSAAVTLLLLPSNPAAPQPVRNAGEVRVLALIDPHPGGEHPVPAAARIPIELLDSAVDAVLESVAARHRHDELEHACRLVTARIDAEHRLDAADGATDTMAALVRLCAEISGKPVLLCDPRGRVVTAAGYGTRVALPDPAAILRAHGPAHPRRGVPTMVPTGPDSTLTRRKLLAPIVERDNHFGWLVLDEYPAGFADLDQYILTRTARRLGTQFLVQHRIARVAWNARSSLTRQLVRGSGAAEDLAASGEYLGVNTQARRALVYVLRHRTDTGDLERELAQRMEHLLDAEVLSTRGSEGILLLVEADDATPPAATLTRVKTALAQAATELRVDPELIAGVSGVCEPSALARAYREAREVAQCIDRFSEHDRHRILAVDDLGPARLFLANGPVGAIHQFVEDTLGPLLRDEAAGPELLRTLDYWFGNGRSVRGTAAELGVHENTVRLRLAKVHTITGLDVAGHPADQLSVQSALLVQRLRGSTAGAHPRATVTSAHTGNATDRPADELLAAAAGTEERRTA